MCTTRVNTKSALRPQIVCMCPRDSFGKQWLFPWKALTSWTSSWRWVFFEVRTIIFSKTLLMNFTFEVNINGLAEESNRQAAVGDAESFVKILLNLIGPFPPWSSYDRLSDDDSECMSPTSQRRKLNKNFRAASGWSSGRRGKARGQSNRMNGNREVLRPSRRLLLPALHTVKCLPLVVDVRLQQIPTLICRAELPLEKLNYVAKEGPLVKTRFWLSSIDGH